MKNMEIHPEHLKNFTKQDSIVLNLQRACEASIGLAMHIVAEKKLGLPQNSRDAFTLLEQENIISSSLSSKMKAWLDLGTLLFMIIKILI